MTGQQLKNSILQLAIQGKLVPQNPDDEPASELLKRIRAEKEKLVKEKKLKKSALDVTPISEDDKPFEIPEGWEWVRIPQIGESQLGKTKNPNQTTGKLLSYLCSINVYWSGIRLDTVKEMLFNDDELEKYQIRQGDMLVCEGGDCGRAAIWKEEFTSLYQNALHRLRFYQGVNAYYIKYCLSLYHSSGMLEDYIKGETIKHLVKNQLDSILFPLPPLHEQHRIVERIEELMPLVDKYDKAQKRFDVLNANIPEALKKSILQEAIQGKLGTNNPDDESASELLKRIRAEKEKLIKEKKIKKDKLLPEISEDEKPFEIPDNWVWVRHNEIFEISGGAQPPKSEFSLICGKGMVRLYQIRDYGPTPQPIYIKQEKATKRTQKGDILLARYGGSLGKVFWAEEGAYNVALAKVIPLFETELVDKQFMFLYYHTSLYRNVIFDNSRSAQGGFNKDDLKSMVIPLPPLQEQHRIVEKLNELLPKLKNIR